MIIPPVIPPTISIPTTTLVISGCDSRNTGFSVTTGQSCIPPVIPGCSDRTTGFSITTGNSCVGNYVTSTPLILPRTLWLKMTGEDVKVLQIFLNTHGYPLASTGYGSLNNETTYFGSLTQVAVIKFQKANNITPAVGYLGPITLGVINKLINN